jgi:hypothetical protein
MGEGKGACTFSVRKSEEKRPLERPRRRWEGNVKIDLQVVGWGSWTGLSYLRIQTGGVIL